MATDGIRDRLAVTVPTELVALWCSRVLSVGDTQAFACLKFALDLRRAGAGEFSPSDHDCVGMGTGQQVAGLAIAQTCANFFCPSPRGSVDTLLNLFRSLCRRASRNSKYWHPDPRNPRPPIRFRRSRGPEAGLQPAEVWGTQVLVARDALQVLVLVLVYGLWSATLGLFPNHSGIPSILPLFPRQFPLRHAATGSYKSRVAPATTWGPRRWIATCCLGKRAPPS